MGNVTAHSYDILSKPTLDNGLNARAKIIDQATLENKVCNLENDWEMLSFGNSSESLI